MSVENNGVLEKNSEASLINGVDGRHSDGDGLVENNHLGDGDTPVEHIRKHRPHHKRFVIFFFFFFFFFF